MFVIAVILGILSALIYAIWSRLSRAQEAQKTTRQRIHEAEIIIRSQGPFV